MPRISSFYGISIYMYFHDHEPAHFHAACAGREARFAIDTLRPMDPGFPRWARRRVQEWGLQHRPELRENWLRARRHAPLAKIDPLP
ncbi:MAG TPA: DUF4160 domain-containing protein [Actinomycetota bacterium]|nr:DUF4160 domain-containing protein [Actinomycetota bacterium]